jgi:hypothetical protein|tara:strand:- start:627 stop:770 length:144 start_codon:yes stop_codon:yes gene_type:complete
MINAFEAASEASQEENVAFFVAFTGTVQMVVLHLFCEVRPLVCCAVR